MNALVQISHGMCEYTGRYEEFASYLTGEGYGVCINDHAGHGGSVKETFGYFGPGDGLHTLIADMHALHERIASQYPGCPYYLLGHSMGSFLSRYYAASYGESLSGLLLSATGQADPAMSVGTLLCRLQVLAKGPESRSSFIHKASHRAYNKRFLPLHTGSDWLTRDRAKLDSFTKDPLSRFRFTCSAYATLLQVIQKVSKRSWAYSLPKNLPVFLFSGSDDPVGRYGKGVLYVRDMLSEAGIQADLKLYPGGRHEMLNETNRQEVYEDIKNWLVECTDERKYVPARTP